MISQRDAFFDRLYELAKMDENVILVSADMGARSLDKFRKDFPHRFINAGIAEQNSILISSGLSLVGKKVFVYAIAPFITLRCLEQIRVECSIMNIPLVIVGMGAGHSYDDSGPTHHLLEDIAIMRTMPNITIYNITDSLMAGDLATYSYNANNTYYIRLDSVEKEPIYDKEENFSVGYKRFKDGKVSRKNVIISTGNMVYECLSVAEELKKENIEVDLIDIYKFPIHSIILEELDYCNKIMTVEENFLDGGMGSELCELLNDSNINRKIKRIGITKEQGYSYVYGGREEIYKHYGIDKNSILKEAKEYFG